MFRVVIVAAVSTTAQATDQKASIPQQLEACREVCEARDWRVAATIEIPGHSRNYNWLHEIIRDCPGYGEMVGLVESGQVDLIVVRDYDRLWRTDALRAQLMALCREHHVQVYSLNQPVEPVSPGLIATHDTGQLAEVLFGFISEQENRTRQRRRRVGMENRIKRGFHGGSTRPYGYRLSGQADVPMQIEEDEARWLRWIFQRRAERWGYGRIVRELNRLGVAGPTDDHWRYNTVRYILNNPVYVGTVQWGKAVNEDGRHERVISADLWQATRKVHGFNLTPHFAARHTLSGLTRCGLCGWGMVYSRPYLRCNRYMHTSGRECQSNAIRADVVEKHIFDRVREVLLDPVAFAEARRNQSDREPLDQELTAVNGELAKAEAAWSRWDHLFEIGGITADEMLRHRERLLGQVARLQERGEELKQERGTLDRALDQVVTLSQVVDTLGMMSPTELREQVYGRLIDTIELRQGEEPRILWL